jgi:TolB protein
MKRTGLLLLLLSLTGLARAELMLEISKSSNNSQPIAVVPFGQDTRPDNLAAIIRNDLAQTGLFRPAATLPAEPTTAGEVSYPVWQAARLNHIVVGKIIPVAPDNYTIQFELLSSDQQKRVLGETLNNIPASRWREAAHFISDRIFQQLTGLPGAFSTRIAYVLQYKRDGQTRYRLEIADADGHRPQTVLDSPEPLLSPAWSPDGKKLAYVSFESRKPAIIVQNLMTQERMVLARFKGLNGAPAWSPDGTRMALTLSQDGNPEIYVMNLLDKKLTRLTQDNAIDTEARWAPDGQSLIFTSDRGGSPQIYRLDIASRDVKRLTYDGSFNARGAISPDGRYLAMVHRERGQTFQIAIQDLDSGALSTLTSTPLDESPSFAPNSQMLVYASRSGNRDVLGIMSLDGQFKMTLPASDGQVREPAWSP